MAEAKYARGKHPNCRNGFKPGHPKYEGCGAPKGNRNSPATEFKKGQMPLHAGKKLPDEWRAKISAAKIGKPAPHKAGANCPFWKGGVTPVHLAIRMSLDYSLWRKAVFARDGYRCVSCGKGGAIEADHIKPFAQFPDLRFAVSNGRTLCVGCHKATETYGRKIHAK